MQERRMLVLLLKKKVSAPRNQLKLCCSPPHLLNKQCLRNPNDSMSEQTMSNSRTTQLEEGQVALKAQVAHMQNVISQLQKNQNHATKEGPTTPIVSPMSVNPSIDAECKLLDWMGTGEVVAEGRWSSSDPNALVHHVPIGPGAMRVWVDVAMKRDRVHLWRPTGDMTQIDEALGSTVAWPADKVIFASSPGSID